MIQGLNYRPYGPIGRAESCRILHGTVVLQTLTVCFIAGEPPDLCNPPRSVARREESRG